MLCPRHKPLSVCTYFDLSLFFNLTTKSGADVSAHQQFKQKLLTCSWGLLKRFAQSGALKKTNGQLDLIRDKKFGVKQNIIFIHVISILKSHAHKFCRTLYTSHHIY